MFKKHMTPLTKGGSLHTHTGKGAVEKPLTPTPSAGMFGAGNVGPTPSYTKPGAMPPDDNDADDMGPNMDGM